MQPSCGMILIFLLARLQWNRSNTEAGEVKETSTSNPSIISNAAPTAANAKENVTKRTGMTSGANSTSPRFSDGTTLSSSVSKDGTNNSTTNFHRSPTSFATFRTTGDSSGVTKSAAATPTSTGTPSHSTVTYSTPGALVLSSDNSPTNLTMLYPVTVTPTSPTVKQDSPTPNFNPIQQTTKPNYNSSNTSSTAVPNPKDASEAKTNKGAVVGVIVGAILGSILIGLIGYFVCRKKRSELFSHRRLYDDTRSDPVLHLDNSLGPYDTSFGGASDDKTSTADRTEEDNAGHPSNGIPMADITPSHPSPVEPVDHVDGVIISLTACEHCNEVLFDIDKTASYKPVPPYT